MPMPLLPGVPQTVPAGPGLRPLELAEVAGRGADQGRLLLAAAGVDQVRPEADPEASVQARGRKADYFRAIRHALRGVTTPFNLEPAPPRRVTLAANQHGMRFNVSDVIYSVVNYLARAGRRGGRPQERPGLPAWLMRENR